MSLTFNEFKEKAIKILNLNLNGYKIKRVKRRTDSLMRRKNIKDYDEFLNLLKEDVSCRTAYLNHLTINTSEFFRNPENFEYLKENIIPELMEKNQKVKFWSAPCSNGAEPYTLAIILHALGLKESQYQIKASDIDSNILETARKGVYNKNSLKNVSENIIKKYFKRLPDEKYKIKRNIAKDISFEKKDLIKESYKKNWDLILCRNFFIYLTKKVKGKLTQKFVKALKPGGYLFLGNTEFIFKPKKYNLEKEHSSFYKKVD